MKAKREPGSRTIKVTDIPLTGPDGAEIPLRELEIYVNYKGQGGALEGITLDNLIMPLITKALNRRNKK